MFVVGIAVLGGLVGVMCLGVVVCIVWFLGWVLVACVFMFVLFIRNWLV